MTRVELTDHDTVHAYARSFPGKSRPVGRRSSPSEAAALSAVVGAAYDAALDPELWPEALRQACQFLNCTAGTIGAIDLFGRGAFVGVHWGYEAGQWQAYLDRYFRANLLDAEAVGAEIGKVLVSSDFADFEAVLESAFYKDWVEPLDIVHGIQGTLDQTASGIALMTCTRDKSVGATTANETRRMKLILPHFRRSFLISKVIDIHKVTRTAFAEAIDALTTAVFLVSATGKVVYANPRARAMLAAGDPLVAVRDRLMASDPKLDRSLRNTFAAAGTGDDPSNIGGVALPLFGRNRDPFVAHILPLTAGARQQVAAPYSAVAALFVRKAEIDLPAVINATRELYGMTPAESLVLRSVLEVGGVAPVAALLGLSEATVKTHLQNLFDKTGTRRQADLVRLVAGFAAPARMANVN